MTQPETNEPDAGAPRTDAEEAKHSSGPSFFKRRGPFLMVGVAAVLAAGFVVYGFLTSDEELILDAPTTTVAETTVPPESTIPYPLSFSEATAQGSVDSIDWGERCDTETGRLAVPDYFAPECMAPFVGDNGGATSPGVGVDTIKIVQYQVADNDPIRVRNYGTVRIDDTGEQQMITIADFMKYYSQFYELYGRSVEIVTYQSKGPANDEAVARADAQRIAEQLKPFAVIGGPALTNAFAEELATRQIVCIDCGTGSTQWFKDRDPFLWSTDLSGTQRQIHVAEFVQKQLAGKPAAYAGKSLRTTPRVFGHVYLDRGPESNLLAEQMTTQLDAVGARPVETIAYTIDPEKMAEKATEIITKLKAAGVTTVILSTDPVFPRELTSEANAQDYSPEWLVAAPLVDSVMYARTYVPSQWEHAFGVTTRAPQVSGKVGNYRHLYEWYMGKSPFADETIESLMPPYAFLMEAIQRTGPNLTPQNLAGAIRAVSTKPGTSQPFYRWGDHQIWTDGDYSGVEDVAMFWWDPETTGNDERGRLGTGAVRFVESGRRFLPGEWTAEERLFVADGAIAYFDSLPEGEQVTEYPSPATGGSTSTGNEIVEFTPTPPSESSTSSAAPGSSTTTVPAG